VVVEGNTDVIALRQAGFEPAVASMGTALTERQLRELGRLTKRLYLCFDADAAGEDATLRGMELAAGQGFDIRVVALPPGQDPADAPDDFEQRLGAAESYLHYRVRLELERATDRQEAFVRAREILGRAEDSPERQDALRLLADRLDLPRETLSRIAPGQRSAQSSVARTPSRLLDAGQRLERDVLAAALAYPAIAKLLAELSADHFDDEQHRRFRDVLIRGAEDSEFVPLRAELDARAERDSIDERTGTELVLRLRERKLRRELAGADLARTTELQAHLAKVRQALAELA
jgi:DNA primase